MTRTLCVAVAVMLALGLYTKAVWQSGFDQGSAVSLCVVASLQNDGKFADEHEACRAAIAYKEHPLWAFRRRGGD